MSNTLPSCVSAAGTVTGILQRGLRRLPAGSSSSIVQPFTSPTPAITPGASVAASQRFEAAPQTELYLIGASGQLQQFLSTGTGSWSGPNGYGPLELAPPGAPVAASQQFGAGAGGQTDVFTVGNNGQLQIYWALASGGFNGPAPIGATGFAPSGAHVAASPELSVGNQTDVFVVSQSGQITVFSVRAPATGAGPWRSARPTSRLPAARWPRASSSAAATRPTSG